MPRDPDTAKAVAIVLVVAVLSATLIALQLLSRPSNTYPGKGFSEYCSVLPGPPGLQVNFTAVTCVGSMSTNPGIGLVGIDIIYDGRVLAHIGLSGEKAHRINYIVSMSGPYSTSSPRGTLTALVRLYSKPHRVTAIIRLNQEYDSRVLRAIKIEEVGSRSAPDKLSQDVLRIAPLYAAIVADKPCNLTITLKGKNRAEARLYAQFTGTSPYPPPFNKRNGVIVPLRTLDKSYDYLEASCPGANIAAKLYHLGYITIKLSYADGEQATKKIPLYPSSIALVLVPP